MPPEVPDQFRCSATTSRGLRCQKRATLGKDVCHIHDPTSPAWILTQPPPPQRQCVAHITGGTTRTELAGQRCESWAIEHLTVCWKHGGALPRSRRAVKVRAATAHARHLMTTYGQRLDTTPLDALLAEVQWTAGHVAWLRQRVQDIESGELGTRYDEDPLVWGVTKRKEGGDDRGVTEEAAPSIWLRLYQQERAHLVRVCAEAVKAGLDERLVRLAENRGQMVAQVIRAILGDLNLTAEQSARVPEIVPRRLRELTSAALPPLTAADLN